MIYRSAVQSAVLSAFIAAKVTSAPPRAPLSSAPARMSVSLPAKVVSPASIPAPTVDTSGTPAPRFTVADVHPSPWINYRYMNGGDLRGDRYTLRQATMIDLISNAYSLDPSIIQGGPSWLELDRFDIVASAPRGTPAATLRLMLRSLLVDRFGLVTHSGTAPMSAWLITAVKPRLAEASGGRTECTPTRPPAGSTPMVAIACHNMRMEQFAPILQRFGDGYFDNKPVVDSTSLRDNYDFEFHWTPKGLLGRAGADSGTIFDAIENQLGLKLDLQTAPRPILIVDRVNRTPTPNVPDIEEALPPEPPPHFEVAVIKPSRPDEQSASRSGRDRIEYLGNSLKYLIQFAWNLNLDDDDDIVGLPKWGASDRYDVQGKASSEDLIQTANGPQIGYEQARHMLQTLLIERFGIRAHIEERSATAYNLQAASPRLRAADPAERTKCGEGPAPGGQVPRPMTPIRNRVVLCQNITMAEFGRELPFIAYGYIYSPVLDETGLKGRYDFTLSFSSASRVQPGDGGESSEESASGTSQGASLIAEEPNGAISLFDAVRHQLGLRLAKVRRPVPILIIEHINRQPSAN